MNIFVFHRDLRLIDNTSLISQLKSIGESIVPIFIFPPEQINPQNNKYFSHNSVQFMIQSLRQLDQDIKTINKNARLYLFQGKNMDVLKNLNQIKKIKSIAFNYDYTPYAKKRDQQIINWAKQQKIQVISEQDYVLYNILDKKNCSPKTGNPYLVFTPFKNHCLKQLKVRKPDSFNDFKIKEIQQYEKSKYYIPISDCDKFFVQNKQIKSHGGRANALQILQNIKDHKNYNQDRNFPTRKTTYLSPYLHFTTVSIRQVYHIILKNLGIQNNLINQLHWRDFYTNITYYHPRVLSSESELKKNKTNKNKQEYKKSFQPKFDDISWKNNQQHLKAWKQGKTGFPIVDAAMRQLNTTGHMHNRCRMIVASFFAKDLFLDWRQGQKYFANKLTDYSPMQNSGGWQWCVGNGTDAQPYFRIFNPWTQQKNYDQNCIYIKKWIPQLKALPNQDIHKWDKNYHQYIQKGIKYYPPIIDHDVARKQTLEVFKSKFG